MFRALNAGSPDAAFGDVNDTAHRQIIAGVADGFQIRQNVLDFLSGIKVNAADDLIRNVRHHQFFLEKAGLSVGPVQNSTVFVTVQSFRYLPLNIVADKVCLLIPGAKLHKTHLAALAVVCPQGLFLTSVIVMDHTVGDIQNIFRGTIVLFQPDHLRIRKNLLEVQDIADVGPAKAIDGLIVISDDAQIFIPGREKMHKLELSGVGVLIFIDHDEAEAILIIFEYIRTLSEKLYRFEKKIIKVKCIVLFQLRLIFPVNPCCCESCRVAR